MGGVDLSDMLVALYRTGLKTHKWYMAVFSQLLDICINNAWLTYRRDCNQLKEKKIMRLKEFRINVAIALSRKENLKGAENLTKIIIWKMYKRSGEL
jgi:hypothetical protein